MDAEMFSTWLDVVVSLTPDQRRKTFMMMALREAGDEIGLAASEVGDEAMLSEAPALSTAGLGDGMKGAAVPSAVPARTDGKLDALRVAADQRVQMRGCPHCDAKEVRPWGRADGLARYRCTDCRRTFNALSGTSLARLRHKDRWPDQARALMTGESVAEAASRCGVAYTTAFRWRHRFLAAPARDKPPRSA